jgi:WD40 repeat protein
MNQKPLQPAGFHLLQSIRVGQIGVNKLAWSPNGQVLASTSGDGAIRVWDPNSGNIVRVIEPRRKRSSQWFIEESEEDPLRVNPPSFSVTWSPSSLLLASSYGDKHIRTWRVEKREKLWLSKLEYGIAEELAWSPDGQVIAAACSDNVVRIFDARMGKLMHALTLHSKSVKTLGWSPDGSILATGSSDNTILLWNPVSWKMLRPLTGHADEVWNVAWSPIGDLFATASKDKTIRLWNTESFQLIGVFEGHTKGVTALSFSSDGNFLATRDAAQIGVWRCADRDHVADFHETAGHGYACLSFHPRERFLATTGEDGCVIHVWELDYEFLLSRSPIAKPVRYSNAKVVLLGDSGVGKSGLGLVLSNQSWEKTESTHGRRVWLFDSKEIDLKGGIKQRREILLWDLAGQPDYRLIHQLHLIDAAVVLVVFDSRSPTDPFAGVRYWDRAIQQAQRIQTATSLPAKKFLVGARIDVGRIGVSAERLESLKQKLGFDSYFETSAKEGWGIPELATAIRKSIDWKSVPVVSSNELFDSIREFLLAEKGSGRLLSSIDDLYRAYLSYDRYASKDEDLRAQFETCIGRMESRGLIQSLGFGNLILLQPELRDSYAAAMANAAKDEPDGLGSIKEDKARAGEFRMPSSERIKDTEQEKLLLISTVEDLLRHEIALREQSADGSYLVFPSQLTRENPDLPDPDGKSVVFTFEGPVLNIYATLAVRLSHSGLFIKQEMWKNAASYRALVGGSCGIYLREVGEGQGELTLFFDEASEETQFQFEEYIRTHLERQSLPKGIHRQRIFICPGCETPVSELAAKRRRAKNYDWIACNVCEPPPRISILDREERLLLPITSKVADMDRAANSQVDLERAASTIQGKKATSDFDVFLCHNSNDKIQVKAVGEQLMRKGILPWLDEWELRPGLPWQRLLEQNIGKIKAGAVFVGIDGIGPWQRQELDAFLREFIDRGCPVIPVILPNALKKPSLPIFLKGMTWVDFRKKNPDPLEQLIWGITGERIEPINTGQD